MLEDLFGFNIPAIEAIREDKIIQKESGRTYELVFNEREYFIKQNDKSCNNEPMKLDECFTYIEDTMFNETLEERADGDRAEVEIEANEKGTAAQIEVKGVEHTIKNFDYQTKLIIKISGIIAEAMNADPLLSEVLPVTTEEMERFDHDKRTYSREAEIAIHAVRYNMGGRNLATYVPYTVFDKETNLRSEKLIGGSNTIAKSRKIGRDRKAPIKTTTLSKLKIEDEEIFFFDINCHSEVIRRIESFLTCKERFNLRAAFTNVSSDKPISRRSLQTTHHIAEIERQDTYMIERRCICQTELYNSINSIRHYGSMMRVIYNNNMTFRQRDPFDVECELFCSIKPCTNRHKHEYDFKVKGEESIDWSNSSGLLISNVTISKFKE
jgi:hypothetical protein